MYLWINGPFGIGKTSTARALRACERGRGRRAWIYDPELAGMVLQRARPTRLRPADFQDDVLWQGMTRAAVALGARSPGLCIVPMTVADPDRLAWLTGRAPGRVVQLTAPRQVIEARIRARGIALDWCLDHLASWPDDDALGARVCTVHRTPGAVAAAISPR